METMVFVDEQKKDLIADPDKWNEKVMELGLTGQMDLATGTKKPNPFLLMTPTLVRTFNILCPKSEDIKDYSEEPIPFAALSAYGLAMHEGYFDKVEIHFHPENPDPIMVGTIDKQRYLMAQWGLENTTLDDLVNKAKKIFRVRAERYLRKQVAEAQEKLQNGADAVVEQHFNGEWTGIY